MTIIFLKKISNAFHIFKWFSKRVEKEIGKSLKCLRSNRGVEFTSNEFEIFCNDRGIKRQKSTSKVDRPNEERRTKPRLSKYITLLNKLLETKMLDQ